MNMRASGASEHRKFPHFHILKLLFPSLFCWYFRYFVSETHSFNVPTTNICTYIARASEASERLSNIYFQDSKYICIHIQSIQFPLITYGIWRYKRNYTDKTLTLRKSINMRASLEKFHIFTF